MVLFDDILKSAAVDKLHHVERQAVVADAQLVDRHDARVFELARDLGFDLEAVDLVGPPAQDTFHGHRPADQGVLGQPDLTHASPGVGSLQKVTTAIGRGRVRPAAGSRAASRRRADRSSARVRLCLRPGHWAKSPFGPSGTKSPVASMGCVAARPARPSGTHTPVAAAVFTELSSVPWAVAGP